MTHAASNVTSAELAENICVPYDRLFKDQAVSRVVQKKATTIKDGKVVLEDGEEIPYAYLVVATGKQWVSPIECAPSFCSICAPSSRLTRSTSPTPQHPRQARRCH